MRNLFLLFFVVILCGPAMGSCPNDIRTVNFTEELENFLKEIEQRPLGSDRNSTIERCFYSFQYPLYPSELISMLSHLTDVSKQSFEPILARRMEKNRVRLLEHSSAGLFSIMNRADFEREMSRLRRSEIRSEGKYLVGWHSKSSTAERMLSNFLLSIDGRISNPWFIKELLAPLRSVDQLAAIVMISLCLREWGMPKIKAMEGLTRALPKTIYGGLAPEAAETKATIDHHWRD